MTNPSPFQKIRFKNVKRMKSLTGIDSESKFSMVCNATVDGWKVYIEDNQLKIMNYKQPQVTIRHILNDIIIARLNHIKGLYGPTDLRRTKAVLKLSDDLEYENEEDEGMFGF